MGARYGISSLGFLLYKKRNLDWAHPYHNCLSRLENDLVCPYCSELRGGVLSLGIHISKIHNGKESWFAQMVCDDTITSLKQSYQSKNKDKRIAASIAGLNRREVRYYRIGSSNYRMPEELRFQTVRIRQ